MRGLQPRLETFCHVCDKERGLKSARVCAHGAVALESVSALFRYQDRPVRRLIHALKYYFLLDTLKFWEAALRHERADILRFDVDLVIPLPLHKRKLRERGFNQAELIARSVASIIQKPLATGVLFKYRSTPPQMKMKNPASRARNIREVFRVEKAKLVFGRNILLVDDVITTGATLEEAARTLRAAGARKVYGFVLARD